MSKTRGSLVTSRGAHSDRGEGAAGDLCDLFAGRHGISGLPMWSAKLWRLDHSMENAYDIKSCQRVSMRGSDHPTLTSPRFSTNKIGEPLPTGLRLPPRPQRQV